MALIPSCALCLTVCDAQSFLTSCEHFFCGRCVRRLQHPALRSFNGGNGSGEDKTGLPFEGFGAADSCSSVQGGVEKAPPSTPVCPVCKARDYQLLPITHKNLRPLFEDTSATMERNQRVVSAQLRHYRQIHQRMTDAFKVLNTNYRALEKKIKSLQQELKDTKETLRTLQQYTEKQKQEIEMLSSQKAASHAVIASNGEYFSRLAQGEERGIGHAMCPPASPSTRYSSLGEQRPYLSSWEERNAWSAPQGDPKIHATPPAPPLSPHFSEQGNPNDCHRYSYPCRPPPQVLHTPPCPPSASPSSSSPPPSLASLGWAATSSTVMTFKRSREKEQERLSPRRPHRGQLSPLATSQQESGSRGEPLRGGGNVVHRGGVTECGVRQTSSPLSREGERGERRSMSTRYPSHSPSPIATSSHGAAAMANSSSHSTGAGGSLGAPYALPREVLSGVQKSYRSMPASPSPSWRSTASPAPVRPTGPTSRMLASPMKEPMILASRLPHHAGNTRR